MHPLKSIVLNNYVIRINLNNKKFMNELAETLEDVFGFSFRPGQEEIINHLCRRNC